MKTNTHIVERLAANEIFLAGHHLKNDVAVHAWNKWVIAGNANKQFTAEAVNLFKQLQLKEKSITEEHLNKAINRLMLTIRTMSQ